MAWHPPRTWSTGDLITAGLLNDEVRDNLIDVGSPPIGVAVMSGTQVWNSVGAEAYATRIALDSLPISKDTTLVSNAIVVGVAGIWQVSASVRWPSTAAASASSVRAAKLYVNNAASAARDVRLNVQNVDTVCTIATAYVSLSAGGFVDVRGWQNSGGNLTIGPDIYLTARLVYR